MIIFEKNNFVTRMFVRLIIFVLYFSVSGCIFGKDKQSSRRQEKTNQENTSQIVKGQSAPIMPEDDSKVEFEVASMWQTKFKTYLVDRKIPSHAWALYSEGGWVDDGQIMVVESKGSYEIVKVARAGKEFKVEKLSDSSGKEFVSKMSFVDSLTSVQTKVFDNLRFLFCEYKILAGQDAQSSVSSERTVHINAYPIPAKHQELIDLFKQFKK